MSVHKKFSPIGSALWPAKRNKYIYTNVFFYYIDFEINEIRRRFTNIFRYVLHDYFLI